MTAFLSSVLRFGNVVRDCKLDVTQPRKKIIHGFYDEGARFLCSHSLGRSLSLSLSLPPLPPLFVLHNSESSASGSD